MKFILYSTVIAAMFTGAFFTAYASKGEPEEKVSVIAMYMYADWCGACQAIKPKMAEATRQFEGQPILFTKMDMTDSFTSHQSELLASRLGLSEIFEKNAGKTGFVLLVDANTYEILDKITSDDETEGIIKKITSVLK